MALDRHGGGVLDQLHRDLGLDVLDPLNPIEMGDLEAPTRVQVLHHDPQHEVTVTGHQMAFGDLLEALHRVDECCDRLLVLALEPDESEHCESHVHLVRIEKRNVACDDAGLLKQLYPSKAWGR